MAELTAQATGSVVAFLDAIPDEQRRADCRAVCELLRAATGQEPVRWGASIAGFGDYRHRYASGRDGGSFLAGFNPTEPPLQRLGKHTTGKACLSLKRLSDVDSGILRELVTLSAQQIAHVNPLAAPRPIPESRPPKPAPEEQP